MPSLRAVYMGDIPKLQQAITQLRNTNFLSFLHQKDRNCAFHISENKENLNFYPLPPPVALSGVQVKREKSVINYLMFDINLKFIFVCIFSFARRSGTPPRWII